MEQINLKKNKTSKFDTKAKYYLMGIGGVSMSVIAIMLKEKGFEVGGSDITFSRATQILEKHSIMVDLVLNEEKIKNADVIVLSSAIKEDNPHYLCAKKHKKKMLTRGQLLGMLANDFEKVIAIAGSHGKTTTTAMIYEILKCAGKNPTLHFGGFRIEDGQNYENGGNEFFVTEACEYHDNFLNLFPYISVVTNVEKEHMDYFKTFERQLSSFEQFRKQSEIVVEGQNNLHAKNLRHDKNGYLLFSLCEGNKKIMDLHLHICEEINTQNCIYAYQVAKLLQIPDCYIKMGLERFKGVSTRFEKVDCQYFDNVICDYAHHPTEISKAIKTAKKLYKNKTLITIFQPHTFSRTKTLLPEFIDVFKDVEIPVFFKTYSAREREDEGMSAKRFTEILKNCNENAKYFDNYEDLFEFLMQLKKSCAVLLFLGAGDLPVILHKNNFIS